MPEYLIWNFCMWWYNRAMENTTITDFVNNHDFVKDYLKSYVAKELRYLKEQNPAATLESLLQQAINEAIEVLNSEQEDLVYNY